MDRIKRYSLYAGPERPCMQEVENGAYVEGVDYDALALTTDFKPMAQALWYHFQEAKARHHREASQLPYGLGL